MPILHAIVLGLVQGLSEFLPISSSGHLLLVPWLFGWDDFDDESTEKAFDVALHIGTLVAAIAYFRHDLARYIRAGLRTVVHRDEPVDHGRPGRLAAAAVDGAGGAVGAVFEDSIDENLGTPAIIAVSLILGGLLLAVADRTTGRRKVEDYGVRDASPSAPPRRWRSTRARRGRASRSPPGASSASTVTPRRASAS